MSTQRRKYRKSVYAFGELRHRKIICGIYKITSPNWSVYIGQTRDAILRFRDHKLLRNKYLKELHQSLITYGHETHSFEVIHELPNDVDQSILDTYEILYISQYKECGIVMFNNQLGGIGGKHSDKTKELMRKNNTGKVLSEEHKINISNAHKGKMLSEMTEEKKRKISATLTGRKQTEQQRQAIKDGWMKKERTPELHKAYSDGAKKGWLTRKNKNNA